MSEYRLPPVNGLRQQIAAAEGRAKQFDIEYRSNRNDPRSAHEAGESARRERVELERLEKHLEANAEVITEIERLIGYLKQSTIQSPARMLAMRDLESAADRLRRELGHF